MKAATLDEVRSWPATCDVASAARALGISRSSAYEQIQLGRFPVRVVTVGHRRRVVTAGLVQLLAETGTAGP